MCQLSEYKFLSKVACALEVKLQHKQSGTVNKTCRKHLYLSQNLHGESTCTLIFCMCAIFSISLEIEMFGESYSVEQRKKMPFVM